MPYSLVFHFRAIFPPSQALHLCHVFIIGILDEDIVPLPSDKFAAAYPLFESLVPH
jgi:hypothetical protein